MTVYLQHDATFFSRKKGDKLLPHMCSIVGPVPFVSDTRFGDSEYDCNSCMLPYSEYQVHIPYTYTLIRLPGPFQSHVGLSVPVLRGILSTGGGGFYVPVTTMTKATQTAITTDVQRKFSLIWFGES